VLEPQGTALFLLLMAVFGGLLWWVIVARQVVFRVLAACLTFVPAMLFGVAAVNKYYDYYQSWGAIVTDLTNRGVQKIPAVSALSASSPQQVNTVLGQSIDVKEAAQSGFLFETQVAGARSGVVRPVYVFLPPQYFRQSYASYRFPAVELLHGSPGEPQAWISALNVIPTLNSLIASNKAAPVVLVIPDADGGFKYSLQCLNQVGGIQDQTFLVDDLPSYIASTLRVQPAGKAWGIAGYSEGGFCAANLSLQNPDRFGYAGVLSGYFAPLDNRVGNPPHAVNPFPGSPALRVRNTPQKFVSMLGPNVQVPLFYLAAGRKDPADVLQARSFRQLLLQRQADVPLLIVPNGAHDATVWRAALQPMLGWMTTGLTRQAELANAAPMAAGQPGTPIAVTPSGAVPGSPVSPGLGGTLIPQLPKPRHS
jgi:enterochelin esterase-like enzyme